MIPLALWRLSAVAFAWLGVARGQRTADSDALLELPLLVPADVSLVSSSVD
jgi:hypothetical protein